MPSNPDAPRSAFREGYLKAMEGAVDRCRIELRGGDISNVAIFRCIDAIEALDVRHAMNARLATKVREAVTNGS